MIVQTIVQICTKFLIFRLKIGGAMAFSLLPWQLPLFFISFADVVFEGIEERIWFIYFSGSLVDSFCSPCLFCDEKRENRRKAIIINNDVIASMTSSHLLRHNLGMCLNYFRSFSKLFYRRLEKLICVYKTK